jgi:hypothetical protein
VLTVEQAGNLFVGDGTYQDPTQGKPSPVACPGTWAEQTYVSEYEQKVRLCLPRIPCGFTLLEQWSSNDAQRARLTGKDVNFVLKKIDEVLGIHLSLREERLFNFLVVVPVDDVRVRLSIAPSQRKMGLEIRPWCSAVSDFLVVVRSRRDNELVGAVAKKVGLGLHVLDCCAAADERDVEVYDSTSGRLLWHEGGLPTLRQIAVTMHEGLHPLQFDVDLSFLHKAPIRINVDWRTGGSSSVVGTVHEWEKRLRDASRIAKLNELRASRRYMMFRGSEQDREQAVRDIRRLIGKSDADRVRIIDPYFGPMDALTFLFFVADPTIPIQVLTKAKLADADSVPGATSTGPVTIIGELGGQPWGVVVSRQKPTRREQIAGLQRAFEILRQPAQNSRGLQNLQGRIAEGAMFHDRFLIVGRHAWQLGCSFNQIGSVMSTITEFPHPEVLEEEFEVAWKSAAKGPSL